MENKVEESGRFARLVDKLLLRFKAGDELREEVQLGIRHPIVWLKGEALPFQQLRPWELFLFLINGFFGVAAGGWDGRDQLYRYTYKVNANLISVSDIIANIWDGLNDPLIGSWMDRNPKTDNTHRWIHRIAASVVICAKFVYLLDFGFTPLQRIAFFTAGQMLTDILQTMDDVSYKKFAAGVTASSDERGKYQIWWHVGRILGTPLGGIPQLIQGFARDRLAWTDYRLYTRGYAIALPFMLFQSLITSVVRNRVTFDDQAELLEQTQAVETKIDTEEQTAAAQEHKLTIWESFSVLKHNKYMIYGTVASLVASLTPSMDLYPLWRHMIPERVVPIINKPIRGEGQKIIADVLGGIPSVVAYPFLGKFTKWLGGPKRVLVYKNVVDIAANAVRYIFGYKSVTGLVAYSVMGFFTSLMGPTDNYAVHVLDYEMLDYVEYKTGVRSEGVTMAFRAFVDKIVQRSVNSITGNAFQAWTGINNINLNEEGAGDLIPERYRKWAWAMSNLTGIVDGFIWLIARASFPYDPSKKDVIETELAERRALAEQMKAGINEEEPVA